MTFKGWFGVLLSGLLWSSTSFAALQDTPPFYQIDYLGKRAFLLGSIHVGKSDFYPFPQQVERSFKQAGALVLEADISKADTNALLQDYGFRPQVMDAQTKLVMDKFCLPRTQLCQALSSYSPWLQAVQLEMMHFAKIGYKPEYGVEMQLISNNGKRPILELESTEFQFRLLASFDADVQWSMLVETINATDDDLQSMVSAWRRGDEASLNAILQEQMEDPEQKRLMEKLLWQRNKGMADRIHALMSPADSPNPLFIAVGSLHLVGEKSLPAYLKVKGAELTDCWKASCDIK